MPRPPTHAPHQVFATSSGLRIETRSIAGQTDHLRFGILSTCERPIVLHPSRGDWLTRLVQLLMAICFCGLPLICVMSWILPVEVAQVWAARGNADDDFARYLNIGAVTAAVYVIRPASLAGCIVLWFVWMRYRRVVVFLSNGIAGFWKVAACESDERIENGSNSKSPSTRHRFRQALPRLMIVLWLGLACVHVGKSVIRRLWEWPVYRLNSGVQVLPNMSASNQEVIRFLASSTPQDARIFVASDQSLFFLSYYLLPRRIYHKLHPESEHVIPKENQQRRMAAYRLEDLTVDEIRRVKPDYVLEYFEHPDLVDRSRLLTDARWVAYLRQQHQDLNYVSTYEVRLRRFEDWSPR